MLGVSILVLTCPAISAINSGDHDMVTAGKGTDTNLCGYCHIPHNAVGDKIWSDWGNEARIGTGISDIGDLCYTCHDGTATNVGSTTAFDQTKEQHKVSTGLDCDMCHTVHDQNPNLSGKFLSVADLDADGTYCDECHDSDDAGSLGDHTAGTQHPMGGPTPNNCHKCHAPAHGATPTVDTYENPEGTVLTNPIMNESNEDSAYCASCHNSTSGKGGTAFNYVQDGGSNAYKHPANVTSPGTYGTFTASASSCETCHDPHMPTVSANTQDPILQEANTDSAYCTSCHNGTDGPAIGSSHPMPASPSMTPTDATPATGTPWAGSIDDDGDLVADYPGNTANAMACETCHSVHRLGDSGAHPLLRIVNTTNQLCSNCHTDK
jgi:doubled CXXCH motif protein